VVPLDRVIVAGGGIAGLATALALTGRRGTATEIVVVERSPDPARQGAGIVLAPNGIRALDAINAAAAAAVRAHAPSAEDRGPYPFLTSSGRVLATSEFRDYAPKWGAPLVPIRRNDLHRALLDQLPAAVLRTGRRVDVVHGDTGSAAPATVRLSDGTEERADLVVGADGIRSTVRRTVVPEARTTWSGVTSVRGIVRLDDTPYPEGHLTSGRGAQVFTTPLRDGATYWAATVNAAEGEWPALDKPQARERLLATLRGWHDPVERLVRETPDEDFVVTDIHEVAELPRWSTRRMTLVGDAAHAMTPYLGQGANTALEDAAMLATALEECADLPAALAAYEASQRPRVTRIARQSRQMGSFGQWSNPVAVAVRNHVMRIMMRFASSDRQDARLYGWTPRLAAPASGSTGGA
jgi:2-polyprenyl-6-methoxyphenol hydroxylase-like FAD-dependent oxidoreductase